MIDKEYQKKELTEKIDYWVGRLTLAIGQGKFRDEVNMMIQFSEANAFDHGRKSR